MFLRLFSIYDNQKLISKNHDIILFIGNFKLLKFFSISFDILASILIIPNKNQIHPAQVGWMRQVLRAGALGRPRGMEWRGRREGGSGWGTHVNPWLIHVNVWQWPLQYCKVISRQLIKINGKKPQIHLYSFLFDLIKLYYFIPHNKINLIGYEHNNSCLIFSSSCCPNWTMQTYPLSSPKAISDRSYNCLIII